MYRTEKGRVQVPIHFGPTTSVFVVFREPADRDRIVEVTRNGQPVFDWPATHAAAATGNARARSRWPSGRNQRPTRRSFRRRTAGSGNGVAAQRRLPPTHGDTFAPGGTHAGSGIAVGRNGVAVFEHGANYFAPVLVHTVPIKDWTHVAVVYRHGQPSLYLNGVLVHQGLKSKHAVHSSLTAAGGNPQFAGSLGGSASLPRALDAAEIRKLMERMPKFAAADTDVPIELCRDRQGSVVPHVHQSGRYAWTTAAGVTRRLEVAAVPAPVAIDGPWEVSFDPQHGGPKRPVTFAKLEDWTKRQRGRHSLL